MWGVRGWANRTQIVHKSPKTECFLVPTAGVFVLVRWAPVVLFGGGAFRGRLVLVLLSLRVVILMGFMARWVFSYFPLWSHLILADPDLAAIQGHTERVRALDTRAAARQNYTQY